MASSAKISDTGRKGDLEIHFAYVPTEDGQQTPAMYLRNPRRVMPDGNRGAAVAVPLSEMWQFADSANTVMKAAEYAEYLYGFITKDDVYRIADAILEWLNDLKDMPPPRGFSNRTEFLNMLEQNGLVDIRADGESVL